MSTLLLTIALLRADLPLVDAPQPTAPVCVQYCIEGVPQ